MQVKQKIKNRKNPWKSEIYFSYISKLPINRTSGLFTDSGDDPPKIKPVNKESKTDAVITWGMNPSKTS